MLGVSTNGRCAVPVLYSTQIRQYCFTPTARLIKAKIRPFKCICLKSPKSLIKPIGVTSAQLSSSAILSMPSQECFETGNDLNNQLLQFIRSSDEKGAFKCLHEMKRNHVPIRCHYFWPLFIQMHLKHRESGVFDCLDRMLELDVPIDHDTVLHYICTHLNLMDPLLIIRKLQDRNLKVPQILTPICVHLLKDHRMKDILCLCFEKFPDVKLNHVDFISALVEYYISTSDAENTIRLLIRATGIDQSADLFLIQMSQSKHPLLEVEKVQQIITELLRADIHFSSDAVYDLKVFFNKHGLATSDFHFYEKTTRTRPPRLDVDRPVPSLAQMSTTDLELRLITMRSKDLDPSAVLKRLFLKYCKEKKYDKAREVKGELEHLRVKFTPGMLSSSIDVHIHFQEPDEAESILSHIDRTLPYFKVDEYKIVNLACLYAQSSNYQNTLKVISLIRPRLDRNKKSIEHNCVALLSTIQDDTVLVNVFNVLCKNNVCDETSTPILSAIIRHFLKTNNIDKAVVYFKQFASTFRKTALKYELLTACLESDRADNVSLILAEITRLHGKAAASVVNITALADLGYRDELQAFVKDSLQISLEFLTKMTEQIQRIGDESKINSLHLLRDVFEANDELIDHIYMALLQVYCRKNNNEEISKLKSSYEKIKIPGEAFTRIINSRLKIKLPT